ncbi:MAG TPA: V-type ATP synthase subunit I [Acholeplasmataceae bacterium]|nr:V-type ATP synthase subunit I [Acholeplasmataceae bacterium]
MIKPVRKVKIIVPKDSRDELLITLQKEEIVMIAKHDANTFINTDHEDEIISRTSNALNKLSSYKKKNRKFFHHKTVAYNDFIEKKEERIALLEAVESRFDELNFLTSENREEQKLIDNVNGFKKLEYTTKELNESLYTTFTLGYVPENRWDFFSNYTSRVDINFVEYENDNFGHHILIYCDKDESDKVLTQLERFGFVKKELPILEEKIASYVTTKENFIKENNKKIEEIESYLTKTVEEKELELQILEDQMLSEKNRNLVIYKETSSDVAFEGWISVEKANDLQAIVRKVTLEYQLEFEEPTEFDEVPTLLENKKFVKPFESITNTYSVPNYRELDPNPIMSFWYWLIFGVLIGDVGYGLLMVVIFGLYSKYKKPKGEMGDLVKIFTYSGITSVIMGILYGSFFGVEFDLLNIIGSLFGNNNLSSIVLQPMNDPMTMLIFSIGLGIVHIISGLVMKVINTFRNKEYLKGLSEGFSWIFILLGLVIFAIGLATDINVNLTPVALVLIILGLLLIIVAGGLQKQGVLGKVFGGFSGLFSVTDYLSDILSYSRILALALSTAVIAFTMNTLAGLLQTSIIGIFFSLIVYLVGHVFNMAISLLSAYVQNNRLQYLEFYGKFYKGGGYLFQPLTFNTKHINEITKTEEQ